VGEPTLSRPVGWPRSVGTRVKKVATSKADPARSDLEGPAERASLPSRGLWGGDALLLSTLFVNKTLTPELTDTVRWCGWGRDVTVNPTISMPVQLHWKANLKLLCALPCTVIRCLRIGR
jgi:hypothetical protein